MVKTIFCFADSDFLTAEAEIMTRDITNLQPGWLTCDARTWYKSRTTNTTLASIPAS